MGWKMTDSSASKDPTQAGESTAGVAWSGGKCRVPMWMMGCPSGFCDNEAYGPQYPQKYLRHMYRDFPRKPYCYGPCCPGHGGPMKGEPILFMDGTDGCGYPMWCAVMPGFINLQESPAGFDSDPVKAVAKLCEAVAEETAARLIAEEEAREEAFNNGPFGVGA